MRGLNRVWPAPGRESAAWAWYFAVVGAAFLLDQIWEGPWAPWMAPAALWLRWLLGLAFAGMFLCRGLGGLLSGRHARWARELRRAGELLGVLAFTAMAAGILVR
jgi:hypothetical protein